MPDKTEAADRWGGPGSSHQDRNEPRPDPVVKDPDDPGHLSRHSQRPTSGETDVRHGHSPEAKRDRQADADEKKAERGDLGAA